MLVLVRLEDYVHELGRNCVFMDRKEFLAHDDLSCFQLPRDILLELGSNLERVLERSSQRNHVTIVTPFICI